MSNQKWASTAGNFLSGKREGGGMRERERGSRAGQQAGIFKVKLGRDRDRGKET